MYQVENITTDSRQRQTLALPNGDLIVLEIYFVPMQLGWFITELTHKDFTLNNVRIINSPNMLEQFKNQIPFGLACATEQEREPTQLEDFQSGASKLYIITPDEVAAFQEFLASG